MYLSRCSGPLPRVAACVMAALACLDFLFCSCVAALERTGALELLPTQYHTLVSLQVPVPQHGQSV